MGDSDVSAIISEIERMSYVVHSILEITANTSIVTNVQGRIDFATKEATYLGFREGEIIEGNNPVFSIAGQPIERKNIPAIAAIRKRMLILPVLFQVNGIPAYVEAHPLLRSDRIVIGALMRFYRVPHE